MKAVIILLMTLISVQSYASCKFVLDMEIGGDTKIAAVDARRAIVKSLTERGYSYSAPWEEDIRFYVQLSYSLENDFGNYVSSQAIVNIFDEELNQDKDYKASTYGLFEARLQKRALKKALKQIPICNSNI